MSLIRSKAICITMSDHGVRLRHDAWLSGTSDSLHGSHSLCKVLQACWSVGVPPGVCLMFGAFMDLGIADIEMKLGSQ